MSKRGSLVSMAHRNWQANKASVMNRIRKKYILVQARWRILDSILFGVGAGETPDRAICPCERNRRSQTVSASKKRKKRKEKRKRRGVTGEMVGGREGGRTGRHCVLSSPFYSFTPVPFWPLGGMVTEEGVRNVLLLEGCHLRTEGSFVCCVLYEEE